MTGGWTQDSDSLSVASTTLTDSGFSFSVRSICVGVGLAKRFKLMSADASTLRCPLFSFTQATEKKDLETYTFKES
ncbi:hypothetical protein EYF80_025508 [Liparis tanakae]|uniref:Uncharacterized protein n=1 Tax=Liparis tanakae TaxID=230148 RepID=A0A4Z2HEF6_9TELE|nr:hypothetical protein EYF80_025508 [Liparis tanakae]